MRRVWLLALALALGLIAAYTLLRDPRPPFYDLGKATELRVTGNLPLTPEQQSLLDDKLAHAPFYAALAVSPGGAAGGVISMNSLEDARHKALHACWQHSPDCTIHAEVIPAHRPLRLWLRPGVVLTDRQAEQFRATVPGSATIILSHAGRGPSRQIIVKPGQEPDLANELRICEATMDPDVIEGFPCRAIAGRYVDLRPKP